MTNSGIRMDGKVVLVTGGVRGIGLGIAQKFHDAGAIVVVCARNTPAEALPFEFVQCDVRNVDAARAMIDGIAEKHGRFDVLVNNAGGSPEADAATVSPRFTESIIALNLLAPLNLSQAAHRWMQGQEDGGSIINIASVSGVRASPGTMAYSAAKGGLLAATRTLGQEWGPKVRVNSVVVGYIATDGAGETYGNQASRDAISANIGAKRLGRSEEIADAVLFLASPMASYILGAALTVDGGGERPPFLDIVKAHAQ